MGVTEKVWGALTAMIKLEDKVTRQAEAMKQQQARIEDLTGRMIRLETQLDMMRRDTSRSGYYLIDDKPPEHG